MNKSINAVQNVNALTKLENEMSDDLKQLKDRIEKRRHEILWKIAGVRMVRNEIGDDNNQVEGIFKSLNVEYNVLGMVLDEIRVIKNPVNIRI
jgi:hypothetical protein